jgi:FkbM family methyltransferase
MKVDRAWLRRYRRVFGWRGLLYYLTAEMLGRRREVALKLPDHPAPIYVRLGTSDVGFYDQIVRRGAYDLPLTRPPQVIVDAGANIGLASRFFAARYPQARILALEPAAVNYAQLCKNVAGVSGITPLRAALWSEAGEVEMANPTGRHGAFRTQRPGLAQGTAIERAPAVTMSGLMASYALSHIDLLKVDIEGAEREVFADAVAWIDRVGVIIVELHDRFQRGCALSFYTATQGFEVERHMGEHVCVARCDWIETESAAYTAVRFGTELLRHTNAQHRP